MPRRRHQVPTPTCRTETLYDGEASSSVPVTHSLGHNLDYSGYARIIEETYRLDYRMRRLLPFCIFQHAMVVVLNAYLIRQQKLENTDSCFNAFVDPLEAISAMYLKIPAAIHEYISGIGKIRTPAGDVVRVNLPDGGTPQGMVDKLGSGSFGPITAANHNAYECYWSPFISKQLVERTRTVNEGVILKTNFSTDWNPFPPGTFPAGATVNSNLLGYHIPERVHPDAMNLLYGCDFMEGDHIQGVLCLSFACMQRTSTVLSQLNTIDTRPAVFPQQVSMSIFIIKELSDECSTRILDQYAALSSPFAFGSGDANKATYFGYKRRRHAAAAGMCMSVGANPMPGFLATINSNFEMLEPFLPRNQHDRGSLRENNHRASSSTGYTGPEISAWLHKHFKHFTFDDDYGD